MIQQSRTKRTMVNSVFGLLSYVVVSLLTFITQRFFVRHFGYELLGLNSLFLSIINTLNVVEIGIGTAITFSLYKPLAENNQKKVAALIFLFRKWYLGIGAVVLVVGIGVIPFLPALTGGEFELGFLLPVYLIFLANTLISYLLTYNQTLIFADFKSYIQSIVVAITRIALFGAQLAVLLLGKSYLLYSMLMLATNLISNLLFYLYVKNKYPYITKYKKEELAAEDKHTLKKNITALIYHRIGNFLVTGIASFIISIFLGMAVLGYYTNYNVIVNVFLSMIAAIFSGLVSGFGNLIATSDTAHIKTIFLRARFANFVLFALASVGMFTLSPQLMALWLTPETILPLSVNFVICINLFLTGYSRTLGDIRAAAGVFEPDKYLHILIAAINLVLSLVLVKFFGLVGVLLGATICLIIKECIVLPIIGSKYIYGGKPTEYYFRLLFDLFITATLSVICRFANGYINTGIALLDFVLGVILCIIVSAIVLMVIYGRTKEFKYYLSLFAGILKGFNKRDKIKGGNE